MSNRENAKVFPFITYTRHDGLIVRTTETIRESYFTEDGGYMPQHVLRTTVRDVRATDADYAEGVLYCDEMEASDYERLHDI